jgi:hypothetical protein
MAVKRNINYLNRDFSSFRNQLIEFTRTYFPNTYNDFTPTSPGMLFMEQASYIGDILSFYLDNQVQENFLQYAREESNLYELSYMFGYKPKVTTAATTTIDIYQRVPAASGLPDYDYTLVIPSNTEIRNSTNDIRFLTADEVNFAISSSLDPTDVSIYQVDGGGAPQSYLLKKSVKAVSATINTSLLSFNNAIQFNTQTIQDTDIINILDITDSDGNKWYEVDNLGQELVFDSIKNTNSNDPNLSTSSDVPYLLQTKQVQRRFATRFLNQTTLQLQFGAGNTEDTDEEITPNPNNVGLGLPFEKDKLTTAFSPTNFIFTNTYGIAPSNTTLTVRYLTGGGVNSNVDAGTLINVDTTNITFNTATGLDPTTANTYFATLQTTNPERADGGSDGDTVEEIRQNTLATYQNQLRTVTADDYLVRSLSMPSKYGAVSKAYAEAEKVENLSPGETQSSVNLYILSYDNQNKLTTASQALKNNLRTYLSQYRVINDSVKIKDGYVVNIGVNFEVVTYPDYNSNSVLGVCIDELKNLFNTNNWQINEPIILKDLFILLDKVEGVQTVKNININNKTGGNYSNYSYDVEGATINNVVYPSLDPMIFEVKFPNTDIKGRVVPL